MVFLGADFDTRHQASELGASTDQALTLNGGSYSVSMGMVAHSTVAYAVSGSAMTVGANGHPAPAAVEKIDPSPVNGELEHYDGDGSLLPSIWTAPCRQ